MPQQIVINSDNTIRIVETGPAGPPGIQGPPGPTGPPGPPGEGGSGSGIAGATGAATYDSQTQILNVPIDSSPSVGSARTLGPGPNQASPGNDARFMTSAERTKLGGIATGATANDTDANLKARSNHTGTQPASTISNFATEVAAIVDSSTALLPELREQLGVKVDDSTPGFVDMSRRAWSGTAKLSAVGGSTAEVSVLTSPLTVPVPLAVGDQLYVAANGDIKNNSGSTQTATFRVKAGTTATLVFTFDLPPAATARSWNLAFQTDIREFFGSRFSGSGVLTIGAPNAVGLDLGSITRYAGNLPFTGMTALELDLTVQFGAAHAELVTFPSMFIVRGARP